MKVISVLVIACLFVFPSGSFASANDKGITWLVTYDGKDLPASEWKVLGDPNATINPEGLRLVDDSADMACFRAPWKWRSDQEIIVEAKVKVVSITGSRITGSKKYRNASLWPWRDGAAVSVLVSDGRHHDGLVLFPTSAANHTDRSIRMNTTSRFHLYRLIIRGRDMEIWVDGERKVTGQGAFWKPTDSTEPFIQFGSSAKAGLGEAIWASVRLGVRKITTPPLKDPVKITASKSWDIPREDVNHTRPYLYDMGKGLLLMSVAQGRDAFYEPYGVLKSTNAGKTWEPISGLDQLETTPLPMLRRPDGTILGMSRWTRTQPDGSIVGKTTYMNAQATSLTMEDNRIVLPKEFTNETPGDMIICERHVWNDNDGCATMVVWSRKQVKLDDGRTRTMRMSHLVRSTDNGRTWNYLSTIGPGGEPAVVRLTDTKMTAVIRGGGSRMYQMFSQNAGRTWTEHVELEVGKVLPDLVLMSNGILACSYGRPVSSLMFSLDHGKSWTSHHVISDKIRFNYTSIQEISPGRLLYVHDAPEMNAMFIDVQRAQ